MTEEQQQPERIPTGRITDESPTPLEAATVMLLRDGDDGLEVFMLERHVETDFAGGALVFPGGQVTDSDRSLPSDRWSSLDLDAAAQEMEVRPELALGLHVAGVRETFEEAGILLASHEGEPLTAEDLEAPRFTSARQQLTARDSDWDWTDWLAREGLVLDLGALVWWSWWVTPQGLHRRYDTRFFVARLPQDQTGAHDAVETVASRWIRPPAALEAGERGEETIIYPTRKNLESLRDHETVEAVLDAAERGEADRRRTLPEIVREDGEVRIRNPHTGEVEEP